MLRAGLRIKGWHAGIDELFCIMRRFTLVVYYRAGGRLAGAGVALWSLRENGSSMHMLYLQPIMRWGNIREPIYRILEWNTLLMVFIGDWSSAPDCAKSINRFLKLFVRELVCDFSIYFIYIFFLPRCGHFSSAAFLSTLLRGSSTFSSERTRWEN
jgi:hypothetical protein